MPFVDSHQQRSQNPKAEHDDRPVTTFDHEEGQPFPMRTAPVSV
jgi:hypothetical protein